MKYQDFEEKAPSSSRKLKAEIIKVEKTLNTLDLALTIAMDDGLDVRNKTLAVIDDFHVYMRELRKSL